MLKQVLPNLVAPNKPNISNCFAILISYLSNAHFSILNKSSLIHYFPFRYFEYDDKKALISIYLEVDDLPLLNIVACHDFTEMFIYGLCNYICMHVVID